MRVQERDDEGAGDEAAEMAPLQGLEHLRARMLDVASTFGIILRICFAKNPATACNLIMASQSGPSEDVKVRCLIQRG